MAGPEMGLIRCRIGISPHETSRLHRLDLRIPVEPHLVLLEVHGAWIAGWVRWRDGRNGRELPERVTELGADPVDRLLEANRLEALSSKVLDHRQQELGAIVVGGEPFVVEEVPELRHVVGVNAEDAEGFQDADVLRWLYPIRELRLAAALEAHVVTLESYSAPEELDNLRALPFAHVHQTHRRDTPTAPTLGEFLRADQEVHLRMRFIQFVKERFSRTPVAPVARPLSLADSLIKLRVVAHVDHAKGFVLGAQSQGHLAGHALQVLDVEPTATRGVEDRPERLIEDLRPARGRGY